MDILEDDVSRVKFTMVRVGDSMMKAQNNDSAALLAVVPKGKMSDEVFDTEFALVVRTEVAKFRALAPCLGKNCVYQKKVVIEVILEDRYDSAWKDVGAVVAKLPKATEAQKATHEGLVVNFISNSVGMLARPTEVIHEVIRRVVRARRRGYVEQVSPAA